MTLHRATCAFLVIALILAACGGDVSDPTTTTASDDTTTAGAPPSTGTTTGGVTTTTSGATSSTLLPTPTGTCFFLKQYVVTPQDGADGNEAAVAALAAGGVTATALESVAAIDDFSGSPVAGQLDAALDFIDVGSENPLAAAIVLNDAQIPAGPVYVTALAGHWSAKPGTDPLSTDAPMPEPTGPTGDGVVAVVDSGLSEPLPDWMSSPNFVLYDPARDLETLDVDNPASHGTFVTSLIRYLAPEHRVAFARVRSAPIGDIVENNEPLPPGVPYFSTELHVAEAILRIVELSIRMELPEINALNLSLGAYTCSPAADPTLITTVAALNAWFQAFPTSTVFAAGGNELPTSAFWPAAMSVYGLPLAMFDRSQIRGVAATNDDGTEVVWERTTGATITAPSLPARPWINNVAPGCDLLGLRGEGRSETVVWSGSSFATAVSAALYARDFVSANPPAPPSNHDYTSSGVLWENHDSCLVAGDEPG